MDGHQYVWVPELNGLFRMPMGIKPVRENVVRHGEWIPIQGQALTSSADELLDLLCHEVDRLFHVDEDAARNVMGDVSAFETDWWGSHGTVGQFRIVKVCRYSKDYNTPYGCTHHVCETQAGHGYPWHQCACGAMYTSENPSNSA